MVPVLPRVAVLDGLRAVIRAPLALVTPTILDAPVPGVPVVVAALGHTGLLGVVGPQLLEGPGALARPIARLQLPPSPL